MNNRYKILLVAAPIGFVIGIIIIYLSIKPQIPPKPENIAQGDYSYAIEYADSRIKSLMKEHNLPSVTVAMIDNSDVIYKKAYGLSNIAENTEATLDTVYKVGSITKLFTGIEVMRMHEEGLIDIEKPITEYLPNFSINTRFGSVDDITIKSMLNHRSGLPRGATVMCWYWDAAPNVLKTESDSLARAYQAYPVEYRYKYSNVAYNVLAHLIEVVRDVKLPAEAVASGWPYYMKDALLVPLGMEDSSFGSSMLLYGKEPNRDVAMGYQNENGKNEEINQFDLICLGSGNMQSTMNDMIKFTQHILNIGVDNPGIISYDTLLSMYEPQNTKPSDPQPNGLTWFTDTDLLDEKVVFHSGTNQGTISLVMLMPESKLGFIAFSNSDSFEDEHIPLATEVLQLMLEAKTGVIKDEKVQSNIIEVNEYILQEYIGDYVINDEIIKVIKKGENLKVVYQNQKIKMLPVAENKFILSHPLVNTDGITLEFFVDIPNEEDVMIVTMNDHFVCPRYPEITLISPPLSIFTGKYEVHDRTKSTYSKDNIISTIEIYEKNDILFSTSNMMLWPLDDETIIIIGGIFGGETMLYDKNTGNITWQHLIYKPVDE